MSQEPNYSYSGDEDITAKLNEILEAYEKPAKNEKFLHLSLAFLLTTISHIQCRIRPSKEFAAAIEIIQTQ